MFDSSEDDLPNISAIDNDAAGYQAPFTNQPDCENHVVELDYNDIEDNNLGSTPLGRREFQIDMFDIADEET